LTKHLLHSDLLDCSAAFFLASHYLPGVALLPNDNGTSVSNGGTPRGGVVEEGLVTGGDTDVTKVATARRVQLILRRMS
jgi:hypothetical protein